jgi:hypothetical protein
MSLTQDFSVGISTREDIKELESSIDGVISRKALAPKVLSITTTGVTLDYRYGVHKFDTTSGALINNFPYANNWKTGRSPILLLTHHAGANSVTLITLSTDTLNGKDVTGGNTIILKNQAKYLAWSDGASNWYIMRLGELPSSSGTTAQFLRGDETWSDALLGPFTAQIINVSGSGNTAFSPYWGTDSDIYSLQLGVRGGLVEHDASSYSFVYNAAWDNGWKYRATDLASDFRISAGVFQWRTAPSGNAGNSVTFTTRAELDTTKYTINLPIDISNAAAGQIVFPASQNASANANTLDDYEEGNTSPTITSGGGSFTTVSGTVNYTKIGNRVIYDVTVTITTNGTANTYVLVPMPFAAAATTSVTGANLSTGTALSGYTSGSNLIIFKYDGTYPGASSTVLNVAGNFRV